MRVFVTGASGFIGSAVSKELVGAGHQVIGLTRSDEGAKGLSAIGAEPYRGDVESLNSMRSGIEQADAVIHTAFDHNFVHFLANCEKDRRVIASIGSLLVGSNRPFVITSATAVVKPAAGELATEESPLVGASINPRAATEEAGNAVAALGVNVSFMRLAQIHDTRKQGLVSELVPLARAKGVSAYVGDGSNRWPAAHVSDTARLYRLAVEAGKSGATYHAVGEEGIALKNIAEALALGLNVPAKSISAEEAAAHFGWLTKFALADMAASSAKTREVLGWVPSDTDMIGDLKRMEY